MNKIPSRGNLASKLPMLLVIICFLLPLALAWMFVQSPQRLIFGPLLNEGFLLQPPLDITVEDDLEQLQAIELGPSEWSGIVFTKNGCDVNCLETVSKLGVVRDLLGHSGSRFKLVGLFESDNDLPGLFHIRDVNQAEQLAKLIQERGLTEPVSDGVVFLDWRGQIVSYFRMNADPSGIKKDLKRLLRASKIK